MLSGVESGEGRGKILLSLSRAPARDLVANALPVGNRVNAVAARSLAGARDKLKSLCPEQPYPPENTGAEDAGGGDGQDPGPDDLAGHAPADGREPPGGADADDRAGDGMGGRDRDAVVRGDEDRGRGAALGGEAALRLQLRDLRAHGVDDAPAAEERAEADGGVRGENDPDW